MFEIEPYREVPTDLPVIKSEYHVLHFDDEPILYSGKNRYGDIVLGSSVDEDYEGRIERHYCVPVDLATYSSFINGNISYYDILCQSKSIFVVDSDFDGKSFRTYLLPLADIPSDYLPMPDSFCPPQPVSESLALSLYASLKGKLADQHKAVPSELSRIQQALADVLETALNSLRELTQPNLYIAAYSPSSFRIHYEVQMPKQLDFGTQGYIRFYNKLLRFCFNNLPTEMAKIVELTPEISYRFEEIVNEYKDLHSTVWVESGNKEAYFRAQLIENVVEIANELKDASDAIGQHFTNISIFDGESDEASNVVGVIDDNFRDGIVEAIEIAGSKYSKFEADATPQTYEIQIYSFNTHSRKGSAYVIVSNVHGDREVITTRITVLGDEILEETKYTESLHHKKTIQIRATAHRVRGKITRMDILFD